MCVIEFSSRKMFWNKRMAKRSVIGTRVCSLWPQDGRFHPGFIQSLVSEGTITSDAVYVVRFDDGFSLNIRSRNIIGPGFQPVTSIVLKWGQTVFFTLNGREVSGVVSQHDRDLDEVIVNVTTPSGEYFETTRKLEEIRLLESRKSARLVDLGDTDYSKLADLQLNMIDPPIIKKIISSHVIDVPTSSEKHNYRRHRRRQRHVKEEMLDRGHRESDDDFVSMDETVAAMVLTSLSVSPTSSSWKSASAQSDNRDYPGRYSPYPESHLSRSLTSSGCYRGLSERDGYSPPFSLAPLSESAPATLKYELPTPEMEDDDSRSNGRLVICEENNETIFKCTWRGCSEVTTSRDQIERHIRRAHFDRDSDLELTDNEEDFHYTEMDAGQQSFNTMTRCFAVLNTSSQNVEKIGDTDRLISEQKREIETSKLHESTPGHNSSSYDSVHGACTNDDPGGRLASDHDYQRKISRQNQRKQNETKQDHTAMVPASRKILHHELTSNLTVTVDEDHIKKSLSWRSSPSPPRNQISSSPRSNEPMLQELLTQHQAQSPKSDTVHKVFKVTKYKRTRTEVRKCRKVFGMENRDQWCTQCKWKKACTRFID